MKYKGWKTALFGCAAIAWWGLLYPELTVLPDTYRVVYESEESVDSDHAVKWDLTGSAYRELVEAGPDKIYLKSRLAEVLSDWLKR